MQIYNAYVVKIYPDKSVDARGFKTKDFFENVSPLAIGPLDIININDNIIIIGTNKENDLYISRSRDNVYYYLKKDILIPYLRTNNLNFSDKGIRASDYKNELQIFHDSLNGETVKIALANLISDNLKYIDAESPLVEGEIERDYSKDDIYIVTPDIEKDIDYRYNILEVDYYSIDSEERIVNSEKRLIINFFYNNDDTTLSYVQIGNPFSLPIVLESYSKITYKIFEADLSTIGGVKYCDLNIGNGFSFSLDNKRGYTSNIKISAPSSYVLINEDSFALDEDEDKTIRQERHSIEYRSWNYSQLYSGGKSTNEQKEKHTEMTDHEDRRGYLFGIYNEDYYDVYDKKQVQNQFLRYISPKHRFEIIDTSSLSEDADLEGAKEQIVYYSSLDGNFFKMMSNSALGSAIELRTHLAHKFIADDSHILWEQYKVYERDEKTLVNNLDDKEVDKPINLIDFDKTDKAENIRLENHTNDKDNYEKIFNKFKLSVTDEEAEIFFQNNANDDNYNKLDIKVKDGEGTVTLENANNKDKKVNKFTLTTAEDSSIKIENQFEDGKTNIINLTKNLIEIKNAEDKVTIVIEEGKLTITTEDNISIDSSGELTVKSSKDMTLESEGKVTVKNGSGTIEIGSSGKVDMNGNLEVSA
jgi:hypothetical protein